MRLKQFAAAALAAVFTVSMFSGCTKKTSSGDKTVLKWYVCCQPQKDEKLIEERVNELIKDKIDATVDFEFITPTAYTQKMGMITSSGEAFDILFTSNWAFNYLSGVRKGAFTDISELLDKYGKDIKKTIPKDVLDMARVDGKLYAIPNYQVEASRMGVCTYQSLADKYGFDPSSISKIEDIEPYLAAVKAGESEKIPFRFDQGSNYEIYPKYEAIQNNFVYLDKFSDDYKVEFPEETLKKAYKLILDWYQKGYIRADVATYSDDNAEAKAGRYSVFGIGVDKPGFEAESKVQYGGDITYAPLGEVYMNHDAAQSTMNALSANSKHPELAMQLLNIVNTDKEVYNTICYGIEGKHYEKTGKNTIKLIEDNEGYRPNRDWAFGNQFNAYVMDGRDEDVWEKTLEYNDSAIRSRIIGFQFDSTPISTELNNISNVQKEYSDLFKGVCAPEKFDSRWDEYVKKLKEAGLQKVLKEAQSQLDDWVKNYKK